MRRLAWPIRSVISYRMFTDSHCHLNFPELLEQLPQIRQAMAEARVDRALCICTTMSIGKTISSARIASAFECALSW